MISSLTLLELAAAAEDVERFDQPLEVLVRLDVAGIEHERIVELVALAHALDIVLGGRRAEPLVDARCG